MEFLVNIKITPENWSPTQIESFYGRERAY